MIYKVFFMILFNTVIYQHVVANAKTKLVEKFVSLYFNIYYMNISVKNIEQIKQICKELSVKNFSVFGSVLTDNFSSDSDIDFVVDFDEKDPFIYTDLYFQLKEKLEQILNRQIDLIEERGIKNPFFRKEIDESKVVIYG
jgi:predicted nucleotidyltransferase